MVGGRIDRLEGQPREGGIGIEAGQQGGGDVAVAVVDRPVNRIGQGLDLVLAELHRGRGVVSRVVLLHLHVEVELGQGREGVDLHRIGSGDVGPAHFGGDLHQPFGAAGIKGIIEQPALLVLIGLARNDCVAEIHAGQGHRIVLAEGDAADEALSFGRMPAR